MSRILQFSFPSGDPLHTLPTVRCVIDGVGTTPCMTDVAGFGHSRGMPENSTHTHSLIHS
ncbi:hypothetical protein LZ31DRAFT_559359 [Colletotrichum somersetense]|nr:hypothetical protein LZ31DRAFT_559359 [Colletotrichum somersetense]